MSQVKDLKMPINATFGSILKEIQLTNLNFSIQMTDDTFCSIHDLKKKSTQKDLHGVPSNPSPPVLYLLLQYSKLNKNTSHCRMKIVS